MHRFNIIISTQVTLASGSPSFSWELHSYRTANLWYFSSVTWRYWTQFSTQTHDSPSKSIALLLTMLLRKQTAEPRLISLSLTWLNNKQTLLTSPWKYIQCLLSLQLNYNPNHHHVSSGWWQAPPAWFPYFYFQPPTACGSHSNYIRFHKK